MSKTIKFPFAINARGGTVQTTETAVQLVLLSLIPNSSDNPYDRRDGLVIEDPTWEVNDIEAASRRESRVRAEFERLEQGGKARLDLIETRRGNDDDGKTEAVISWTNLETGAADEAVLPSGTG